MRRYLFLIFLSFVTLQAIEPAEYVERIRSHKAIGDLWSARDEAKKALKEHAENPLLQRSLVEVLALMGDDKKLVREWRRYQGLQPEQTDLLEEVCWGIIESGSRQSAPQVRAIATIAAYFGRDVKSVDIICQGLEDQNAVVRAVAAQTAAQYGDLRVQQALIGRLPKENIRPLLAQVIQSLGAMRSSYAEQALLDIASDDLQAVEVKAAAAIALSEILDEDATGQIETLSQSDSWGLRLLACQLIAKRGQETDVAASLLNDHHAAVRCAAMTALGLHRKEVEVKPLLEDVDDEVAITAAWLATIKGEEVDWSRWLESHDRVQRLKATAALKATGVKGLKSMRRYFKSAEDGFVRLNLAIGLIGLRDSSTLTKATRELAKAQKELPQRWGYLRQGTFQAIAPSDMEESPLLDPEMMNQQVRLETLSMLAVLDPKAAQEGIRDFLRVRGWGVAGAATALLLQEGTGEMIDVVRALLQEDDMNLRTQAALILALWGRDAEAIDTLIASYSQAERTIKERILEGLGRIGDEKALTFLDRCLDEPYPTLRLIAASSIIQTINH